MLTDFVPVFVLPLEFHCAVLNDSRLVSNLYQIKLGIDLVEDPNNNIGLSFQRIKYLTENYLQESIFLNEETSLTKNLDSLDNNLVYFPCDPYDVYVGSVLMSKFQSITKSYFDIQYLTISSILGEQIQYNILDPFDSGLPLEGDHWWNQDNVYTGSKTKVTWDELNLTEGPKFRPTLIKGGLSEH